MRRASVVALASALVAIAPAARAQLRPWAVGVAVGPPSYPAGHLGIPVGEAHLPFTLSVQRSFSERLALDLGFGLPHTGMSLALWTGAEFSAPIAGRAGSWSLSFYATPGLQLGFAGPDQAARQRDTFVGYEYAYQPPLAFALRLPAGLRWRGAGGRLDVFAEVVPIVAMAPTVEVLLSTMVGVRVRFGDVQRQ